MTSVNKVTNTCINGTSINWLQKIMLSRDKINILFYTPTVIMLARHVTHMNTVSPGGICYASLEVGWYSRYQPTSTKA